MEWQACGPLGWEISPGGCPKAWLALARPTVLSIPSSPTARLVLSFSFSFSHQPATFVSRQLTGSSRGPLWSTESFSVNIVADPCPCRRLGIRAAQCSRINQCDRRFCTRYTALLHSTSATLANVAVRLRSADLVFSH